MTKQEYALWAQQESPRSRGAVNIAKAFVVGGLICMLGQLLIFFFEGRGAGERAPVFASICLVVLSAALTGLNVYDNLAKHAGAGTLVPITGFANGIASSPALPTRWQAPPWNLKPKAISSGLALRCSRLPGLFWSTGWERRSYTVLFS